MTEKAEGIQAKSLIAGLQKTINNTSLKKHLHFLDFTCNDKSKVMTITAGHL